MVPYFNTSGPCVPGQHHMLPPERRLVRVMELVEQGRYFTLHALPADRQDDLRALAGGPLQRGREVRRAVDRSADGVAGAGAG